MLAETGVVDPDRIGIIGGSYGGYMVLGALAFTPEEFAVGVDIFWRRELAADAGKYPRMVGIVPRSVVRVTR